MNKYPELLRSTAIGTLCLVLLGCGAADAPQAPAMLEPGTVSPQTVLVTGVTGTQGGAVARELLARGYAVRGLTRNPDQPSARAAQALGVDIVKGDFDDAESLLAAMHGAYGVFAVTDTWEHGAEREIAHGRQLIEAAVESGISHFVYTSVAGADQQSGLPHFESKFEVEKLLMESGLDYSVIRPVEFMDNWRYIWPDLQAGRYVNPRAGSERHQWIAAADIGYFVAEAFDNPDTWMGRTEQVAGDELSLDEFIAVVSDVLGQPVVHVQLPWADFRAAVGDDLADMYRWFADVGYDVDIAALRQQYPQLTTARSFLEQLAQEPQQAVE